MTTIGVLGAGQAGTTFSRAAAAAHRPTHMLAQWDLTLTVRFLLRINWAASSPGPA